jgi:aconitate hydratase
MEVLHESAPRVVKLVEKRHVARSTVETPLGKAVFYDVVKLKELGCDVDSLPFSIRVLLENVLRFSGRVRGAESAVDELMDWPRSVGKEVPFMPSRVLLQDYTGVPLVVDLAAMRSAAKEAGVDPRRIDSNVDADLIIDHSVQVDSWMSDDSLRVNLAKEYERNHERYSLLKWAQSAFSSMRVFPPGKGICHQLNLEYLSTVVAVKKDAEDGLVAIPDTLVGTDSHTTMVNGIGVLGWGVGGIEAEAVMLGEPYHMTTPKVVGVNITGELPEGSAPTDVVLSVTESLRKKGVVDQFVEYFGDGYAGLSAADRATLSNMSPEYGATAGFCPVDEATLTYLRATGRSAEHIKFLEKFCREHGFFYSSQVPQPKYSEVVVVDLDKVEPAIAGPRNPDERIPLRQAPAVVATILEEYRKKRGASVYPSRAIADDGYQLPLIDGHPAEPSKPRVKETGSLDDGSVVIAAITSCTNTSNPTVMIGAALVAKKAVELGLKPKEYVKTSMAPGSRVVTEYLEEAGLLQYLKKLGFNVVGYGCTTCIGNSGPLYSAVEDEIKERDLYAVAVLSGNRNFDGRIHPLAKGSFLASPMLVVAYALAGKVGFDFYSEPLGVAAGGDKVFLGDVWPSVREIRDVVNRSIKPELFLRKYADALEGDDEWKALKAPVGDVYDWAADSSYIREPPWFRTESEDEARGDILGARVLAVFEDRVTTDHISPAGTIPYDSPAGTYLLSKGVKQADFSTYGSRRGNHEVMVRGGFGNIRLRNLLAKGKEGGWTTHMPSGDVMTIFDAAIRYSSEKVPLIVMAGKQYGAGSSRDWAAKAPRLLGVKAVLAQSFERIHRSNLVAMGVLPLQFSEGQSWKSLGLTGEEKYDILGLAALSGPKGRLTVRAESPSREVRFEVDVEIENETELNYYFSGGVLPYVFQKVVEAARLS